jgi:hypothetical protein
MGGRSEGSDGIRLGPNVVYENIIHLVLATSQLLVAQRSRKNLNSVVKVLIRRRDVLDLCG